MACKRKRIEISLVFVTIMLHVSSENYMSIYMSLNRTLYVV